MAKMNILHLKAAARIGGAEVMLTFWTKYLNRGRFQQFFIFGERGPFVEVIREGGIEVHCFTKLNGIFGFLQIPALMKFITKNEIAIVHAHGARVNLWGSIAARLSGIPIISTEHSLDLWRNPLHPFSLVDRFVMKMNAVRVGVSPAVCEMLLENGAARDKVVSIDNGIETERFGVAVDVAKKRREENIPGDAKVIGAVGRLVDLKGHRYLVDAFASVSKCNPDAFLLIVGDGPAYQDLRGQVESLGLTDRVLFAGKRDDIPELLSIMDIFVLPSITEGLPLVLLEAMAAQKPIVASRVSGIPFVVSDGEDGLLVPATDSGELTANINFLLDNPDRSESMARRARVKVTESYSAVQMIRKYEDLYTRLAC